VYLPVSRGEQLDRIRRRWIETPVETFAISESEVDQWRAQFQPPDAAELAGLTIPEPPPQWSDWAAWAAERWPSSDV